MAASTPCRALFSRTEQQRGKWEPKRSSMMEVCFWRACNCEPSTSGNRGGGAQ